MKETSFANITILSPSKVFRNFRIFIPAASLMPYRWLRKNKWKTKHPIFKNVVKNLVINIAY